MTVKLLGDFVEDFVELRIMGGGGTQTGGIQVGGYLKPMPLEDGSEDPELLVIGPNDYCLFHRDLEVEVLEDGVLRVDWTISGLLSLLTPGSQASLQDMLLEDWTEVDEVEDTLDDGKDDLEWL